jgi:hypothetical protein
MIVSGELSNGGHCDTRRPDLLHSEPKGGRWIWDLGVGTGTTGMDEVMRCSSLWWCRAGRGGRGRRDEEGDEGRRSALETPLRSRPRTTNSKLSLSPPRLLPPFLPPWPAVPAATSPGHSSLASTSSPSSSGSPPASAPPSRPPPRPPTARGTCPPLYEEVSQRTD